AMTAARFLIPICHSLLKTAARRRVLATSLKTLLQLVIDGAPSFWIVAGCIAAIDARGDGKQC
ncbi:hypothetical protein ACLOJK_027277, partial [Asimina triloba]